MMKSTRYLPLIVALAAGAAAGADPFDALAEIRRCASYADAGQRMECYDALGRRVTAADVTAADAPLGDEPGPAAVGEGAPAAAVAEAAPVAGVAAAAPASQEAPAAVTAAATGQPAPAAALPDDLGGDFGEQTAKEEEGVRGRVTSCRKGPDSKWYFYFEGGQVWKQVNLERPRLRFDDCNFDAVITKDLFGYKMSIEGRQDLIRISRKN